MVPHLSLCPAAAGGGIRVAAEKPRPVSRFPSVFRENRRMAEFTDLMIFTEDFQSISAHQVRCCKHLVHVMSAFLSWALISLTEIVLTLPKIYVPSS